VKGYSARDVAALLGIEIAQVRAWVRAGLLTPERQSGARGEYVFSFQDLVLLRTAKGLLAAGIAPRRVKRALTQLERQLPTGRPLTALSIAADGRRIVARDGRVSWDAEDGQALLDFGPRLVEFEVGELARKVAPLVRREARAARRAESEQGAEDWHALAQQLELVSPSEARDAYRRAVELDPGHADAHCNLGRLLHEAGELGAAEAHYRLALAAAGDHAVAAYNLGVVLEAQSKTDDAAAAYKRALSIDARFADAHLNLARLYEKRGDETAAIRHYKEYKKLTTGR
jgi:tetratricopeptide (TPR) repeat protein